MPQFFFPDILSGARAPLGLTGRRREAPFYFPDSLTNYSAFRFHPDLLAPPPLHRYPPNFLLLPVSLRRARGIRRAVAAWRIRRVAAAARAAMVGSAGRLLEACGDCGGWSRCYLLVAAAAASGQQRRGEAGRGGWPRGASPARLLMLLLRRVADEAYQATRSGSGS